MRETSRGTFPLGRASEVVLTPPALAPFHAFVYQGSGLVDIGTLGGTYSEGTGINDQNEIAGVSSVTGSTSESPLSLCQGPHERFGHDRRPVDCQCAH